MNEIAKIGIHFLVAGKYKDQRHFEDPTNSDWWAHRHIDARDVILFYCVGRGVIGTAIATGEARETLRDGTEAQDGRLHMWEFDDPKIFKEPLTLVDIKTQIPEFHAPQRSGRILADYAGRLLGICETRILRHEPDA
jgi:hypothetical protein